MEKQISCLNLFDMLESRNINFFNFLTNDIKIILSDYNKNILKLKNLTFLYNEFFFKINKNFFTGNFQASLFVPVLLQHKKRNTKKITLFLGNFPILDSQKSFNINGLEKTLIQQTIFDPVIFFEKNVDDKDLFSISGILFNNFVPNIEIKYTESTAKQIPDFYIHFKNENIQIPLYIFLSSLNIKPNLLIRLFPTKKKYINYIFEKKNILTQKEAVVILSKYFCSNNLNLSNEIFLNYLYKNIFQIDLKTRYKLNKKLKLKIPNDFLFLTPLDFVFILNFILQIIENNKKTDDKDCYSNKTLIDFNEFLKQTLIVNINKKLSNKLNTIKKKSKKKILSEYISEEIDEFFSMSDTSLTKEDVNPLTIISQKKKVLTLKKQEGDSSVPVEIREIHKSMFGKVCLIETPEGQSAGLIVNVTSLALTNTFGFLETPFVNVFNNKIILSPKLEYFSSDENFLSNVLFIETSFDKNKEMKNKKNFLLKNNTDIFTNNLQKTFEKYKTPISFLQFFSVACCTIPFLEHNDGNRILMGANMQRQALNLFFPQQSFVYTGFETILAHTFGGTIKSQTNGLIIYVDHSKIIVQTKTQKKLIYYLNWLNTTVNNDIVIREKPNISVGEEVFFGQILVDSFSIEKSTLTLGTNLIVAYLSWEGFNFEDSIIINESLVKENRLTSLHIKKFDIELESDYFNNINIKQHEFKHRNLNQFGLVKIGSFVNKGDILFINESKKKITQICSTECGLIVDIKIDNDILVNLNLVQDYNMFINAPKINIYLLQLNKIKVGDKLSGRFGNKGVISKILTKANMPKLIDGTSIDILLNPLGIPSRMNLGQLYEGVLGFCGNLLNRSYKIQSFDEIFNKNATNILISQKLKEVSLKQKKKLLVNNKTPGKTYLKDGRTGEIFDNPVFVSTTYILKLFHLVDEKIASRTEGSSSLITLQPLRGKAVNGGQRFGEMEIWAIEAYGASFTIQDVLIIKSDDILFHDKINEIIENDTFILKGTRSQTNLFLTYELKALGLDLTYNSIDIYNNKIKKKSLTDAIYRNKTNEGLFPKI